MAVEVKLETAGKIIYWDLLPDLAVPFDEARQIAGKVGLDWPFSRLGIPAILRIISLKMGLKKVRKRDEGSEWVALYQEDYVTKEELREKAVAIFEIRKDGKILLNFKDDKVKEAYEFWKDRIPGDRITHFLVYWIEKNHGFKLRRSGGVYFVPKDKEDLVTRISAWISQLNAGVLRTITVTADLKTVEALLAELATEISFRVDDINRYIEKMGKRLRVSTVSKMLKRLEALNTILLEYEKRFNMATNEDIKKKILDSSKRIEEVGRVLREK